MWKMLKRFNITLTTVHNAYIDLNGEVHFLHHNFPFMPHNIILSVKEESFSFKKYSQSKYYR